MGFHSLRTITIFVVLSVICAKSASTAKISLSDSDASNVSDIVSHLQQTVDSVNTHLEKFNVLYLTTIEQRLNQILNVVNQLDTNVKAIQEKAQVWEIFRHHIEAWTNHQNAVDHKIELLRRKLDEIVPPDSTMMLRLFLNIDRMKEQLDEINNKNVVLSSPSSDERLPSQPPSTFDWASHMERLAAKEKSDAIEKKELMHKLTTIQRQVSLLERDHCKPYNVLKSRKIVGAAGAPSQPMQDGTARISSDELAGVTKKLDLLIDNFTSQEFKQVIASNRKTARSISTILELTRQTHETSNKMFTANAERFSDISNCCLSTGHEITTFTNSADHLLKRIESHFKSRPSTDNQGGLPTSESSEKKGNSNESDGNVPTNTVKSPDLKPSDDGSEEISPGEDEIDDDGSGYNEKEIVSKPKEESIEESGDGSAEGSIQEPDDGSGDIPNIPQTVEYYNEPDKSGCHQLHACKTGIYRFGSSREELYCECTSKGMGWTVIQNRYNGAVSFNRTWDDYSLGFGELTSEFWMGNQKIHEFTSRNDVELRIVLQDWDGQEVWAEYSIFRVDSPENFFNLMIGGYSGTVADSMLYHNNQNFSTYDKQNDQTEVISAPCAAAYGSGWWFNNCIEANLNGPYCPAPLNNNFVGLIWEHWRGDYSLKQTRMMIRPKEFWFTEENDNGMDEPLDDP